MASKQRKSELDQPYKCEYCKKGFAKEGTLQVHMCEQKNRHLQKNEKRVQFGYQTFVRFYQISANFSGVKTYDEFCKSPVSQSRYRTQERDYLGLFDGDEQ